jgi:hypothetical protein
MREMGPSTFQKFIAELWEQKGHDVEVVDGKRISLKTTSGGGILRSSTTTALQPLFREDGNLVDKSDMNRILEIRWEDEIDEIVVVTTTDYTKDARKQGKRDEFTLLDGDDLADVVIEENAKDLVSKYGNSGGSALGGLLWLIFVFPIKLAWEVTVISVKLAWFFVTLPFKLLSGSSDGSTEDSSEG